MGWRKNQYQLNAVEDYLKDTSLVVFFLFA